MAELAHQQHVKKKDTFKDTQRDSILAKVRGCAVCVCVCIQIYVCVVVCVCVRVCVCVVTSCICMYVCMSVCGRLVEFPQLTSRSRPEEPQPGTLFPRI